MTYDAANPYDRVRISDYLTNTFVSFKQTRSGVADWLDGPYIKWKQGVYRSIQDQKHPGFRKNMSLGVPVFGNLLLATSDRKADSITAFIPPYSYGGKTCTYTATGDLAGYYEKSSSILASLLSVPSADVSRMTDIALIDAYAKMNSASLMSGEILNDLDQTVEMLRRPMKGSIDLLNRMTKCRKLKLGKTTASATKATTNAWLEYRYGWKPLLMDADNIVRSATRIVASPKKRLVARASQVQSRNSSNSFSDNMGGTTWLKASGTVSQTESVSVHAGILYDVVNRTTSEELLAFFGLRPRDVPATLWEVVPYSFVVDWFVNVGPWLEAIVPVPGTHVLGTWVTVKSKKTITSSVHSFKLLADGSWRSANGSGGSSTATDSVKRLCDLPMPAMPVMTVKSLSSLRSADGISLLANQVIDGLQKFRH